MSVHCASTGQSSNQRSKGKTKGVYPLSTKAFDGMYFTLLKIL